MNRDTVTIVALVVLCLGLALVSLRFGLRFLSEGALQPPDAAFWRVEPVFGGYRLLVERPDGSIHVSYHSNRETVRLVLDWALGK